MSACLDKRNDFRKYDRGVLQNCLFHRFHCDVKLGLVFHKFEKRGKYQAGDPAGFLNVEKNRWYIRTSDKSRGLKPVMVRRSLIIWLSFYGKYPEFTIDHINRNSADDRICNLRDATNSDQALNQSGHGPDRNLPSFVYRWAPKSKTGIKTWGKYYYAKTFSGKLVQSGYYLDPENAKTLGEIEWMEKTGSKNDFTS